MNLFGFVQAGEFTRVLAEGQVRADGFWADMVYTPPLAVTVTVIRQSIGTDIRMTDAHKPQIELTFMCGTMCGTLCNMRAQLWPLTSPLIQIYSKRRC